MTKGISKRSASEYVTKRCQKRTFWKDILLSGNSPDDVGQQYKPSFLVALDYFFLGGLHMERVVWPPLILEVSWEPAGYCSLCAMTLVELRLFAKLHAIPDMQSLLLLLLNSSSLI